MLAIRLQRTGRKGHAQYRLVVQDSRFTPTSGRVVAYVGSFDPHTKTAKLDVEKINDYLKNGAQPSGRAIKLLESNKVKLPDWVEKSSQKKREVRHPQKRRSTAPETPAEAEAPEAEAADESAEAAETPVEEESSSEAPAEDTAAKEPASEESAPEPEAESAPEESAPKESEADEPKGEEPAQN